MAAELLSIATMEKFDRLPCGGRVGYVGRKRRGKIDNVDVELKEIMVVRVSKSIRLFLVIF